MPTFEACILGPPPGFIAGCRALNSKFKNQTRSVETFRGGVVDILKMGYISALHVSRSEVYAMDALGVVTYLITSWISSTPRPSAKEAAIFLDLNSALSRDVIEMLVTTFCEVARADQSVFVTSTVNSGKVERLRWKLGVAVGSSKCADINAPYVQISLQLRLPGDYFLSRKVELSYDDFLKLVATFKEVFAKLDAL